MNGTQSRTRLYSRNTARNRYFDSPWPYDRAGTSDHFLRVPAQTMGPAEGQTQLFAVEKSAKKEVAGTLKGYWRIFLTIFLCFPFFCRSANDLLGIREDRLVQFLSSMGISKHMELLLKRGPSGGH